MTSGRGEPGSVATATRGRLALRPILWNGWRGTPVGSRWASCWPDDVGLLTVTVV